MPTAQFDPATLAIWTTTVMLPERAAKIAATGMRAAARGDNPSPALSNVSERDPLRAPLLWLTSSVWHEKRHFFDTCLTNYGARRFRDLFTMASNLLPLVAEAKARNEPVWFPVEVYGCPALRRPFGISEPAPNILEIAGLARTMKSFSTQLDAASTLNEHVLHLGGEAQLEGLAQASQIHSLEHCFGVNSVLGVTGKYVHRMAVGGPYRSIETVSGTLGCVKDVGTRAMLVNLNLAAALFFAALCGRFFGVGAQPDADSVSPWPRLARMMDALGPKPGRFDMSDEEAAELVDTVSRRLWGRTAFEEIVADIDAMEAKMDLAAAPWLASEGLYDAFSDFLQLRRRLLAAALEAGPSSALPRAFPIIWRDRLLPWHVVATPGGSFENDDAPVVFGATLNLPPQLKSFVPSTVTWGRLYSASNADTTRVFAPRARAAWLQMLEHHGPSAHLMLNGRRHRRMVPPELERPITEIEKMGIKVRFHPRFEWPEQRAQEARVAEAVALADFLGRKSFVCDITGEEIEPADAAIVTPWEFRRSSLLSRFRQAGTVAEIRLVTDWSDWVVRRDLLDVGQLSTLPVGGSEGGSPSRRA